MQLTGGLSKGLAMLTMDQEYVNRFSVRSVTLQQRLLQGVQALGVGAYEGLLGNHTGLLIHFSALINSNICLHLTFAAETPAPENCMCSVTVG